MKQNEVRSMSNTNIKILRAKYRKTQKEIAELLGVSLVGYHKKENGISPFTLEEAKKLSDLFNLPIESIFFGEIVHAK